ncbi:MAG TPA: hypothetical protein VMM84_19555 [Pyrinomonadaceae bacterium]|nr:hypothetical protein [Pyrinomonadaceae bacterium]
MKHLFLARLLTVLLALSFGCISARGQAASNSNTLTNDSIVKLVKAGFKEKTIISIISARQSRFDLSPERMIELKRRGVSEKIILAMLSTQEPIYLADDSWNDDDPFFSADGDSRRKDPPKSQSPGDGSSADIFGSSGGMRGETRSRGGSGSTSGDTLTTGTATVRIIRPPAEANAPPKLEKTPSLTNNSIMELVEAGFSEGTIIRRIEQSPVDFDLSPDQVAELRKRRVSQKILAAMRTASGEDSSATSNQTRSDDTPKK